MKRKSNRRAFTIVELVIVIAVIAVFAAVLIPTFGNMIESANNSKLMQEAKNAYTQYLIDHADNGEDTEFTIYVSDGKFVSIYNGAPRGVFEEGETALKDLFGDKADEYVVPDAETEGLFICRPIGSSDDDEKDEDDPAVDTNKDLKILAVGDNYTEEFVDYVGAIANNLGVTITVEVLENVDNLSNAENFDYVIFSQNPGDSATSNINSKLVIDMNDSYPSELQSGFLMAIPTYTAVMNSQTSVLDKVVVDGYYISYEYSCYLRALMVVRMLTDITLNPLMQYPDSISEIEHKIAVESVNNAANYPSKVTDSEYIMKDFEIISQ